MKRVRGCDEEGDDGWDGEEACDRGVEEAFAVLEGEWVLRLATGLVAEAGGRRLPDVPPVALESQVRCLAGRRVAGSEREVHALAARGEGDAGRLQRVRLPSLGVGPGGAGLVRAAAYASCLRRAAARRDAARARAAEAEAGAGAGAGAGNARRRPPAAGAQEAVDWFLREVLRAERGARLPRWRLRELLRLPADDAGGGGEEAVLDARVAELMRLGALQRVEAAEAASASAPGAATEEVFWVGVPNVGPLCVAVAQGRSALCACLARCERGTAPVRQLLAEVAAAGRKKPAGRRRRPGSSSGGSNADPVRLLLPPRFVLRDCLGSGRVERVPGPLGAGMVRLPKLARH